MSVSFKLDNNNNIINNSNFIFISGTESLIQDIKNMLYMYKGEYPYNKNKGIDYINLIKNNNEVGLLAEIQKTILSDKRVISVTFDENKINGNLKINLKITSGEEVNFELGEN